MCTLIALHRCVPGAPLVVAANRDEYFDRPAEGPALRRTSAGAIVAPRDLRAGGTWFGVNGRHVFVAVTNQRCDEPRPDRRSRGLLVEDALAAPSARAAAERLQALSPDTYNPFNLFVADRERAFLVTCAGTPRTLDLAPGAHVIGNVPPAEPSPKVTRQRGLARALAGRAGDPLVDDLATLCREHGGEGPLESTCVHAEGLGYGTCSSFLLRLADRAEEDRLLFADGAPCRADYEDLSSLLFALRRGAGASEGDASPRRAS